jgi:uncharacterized protein (DUF433 family)
MTMMFAAQVVPLRVDEDDVIRVGRTRVTLSTVIHAFDQGHTPEEIVTDYPALQLADVYAVITYYLNNRAAVATYLAAQEEAAEQIRHEIEARSDSRDFRKRLLARSEALKGASPG